MMRKKKVLSCLLVPLLSANLLLSGCSRTADEPVTKSGFYFNTVISVSIYEKGSEELLDGYRIKDDETFNQLPTPDIP